MKRTLKLWCWSLGIIWSLPRLCRLDPLLHSKWTSTFAQPSLTLKKTVPFFVGVLMTHRRLWAPESCGAARSGLGTGTKWVANHLCGDKQWPYRRAMWTPGQGSYDGLLLGGIVMALWHSWLILGLIRRDQSDGPVSILVHVFLFLSDSPLEQTVALIIAKYDIIRLYFLGARWGNRLITTAFVSK